MIRKFINKESEGKVILGLLAIVGLAIIVNQYLGEMSIRKNEATTQGVIVDYKAYGKGGIGITYEYKINGKLYEGHVGVHPFKCDDGKKGCVGEEFTVYYSTENPEYSRIDLGKYEKYKATVEFFD